MNIGTVKSEITGIDIVDVTAFPPQLGNGFVALKVTQLSFTATQAAELGRLLLNAAIVAQGASRIAA
jgi:hypothetical protein